MEIFIIIYYFNQFGEKLKDLKELKLAYSNINSISDLGSNFKNLCVLNMDSCNLVDLSGFVCFPNLIEFSAKNNKIFDLFDIESLTNLNYIQLENNKIEEIENILFLANLESLRTLNLKNNQIANHKDYFKIIREQIPWLNDLDNEYIQTLHFQNLIENDNVLNKQNNLFDKKDKLLPKIKIHPKQNANNEIKLISDIKNDDFKIYVDDNSLTQSMITNYSVNSQSISINSNLNKSNNDNENLLINIDKLNSNYIKINVMNNETYLQANKLNPIKFKQIKK